MYGTPYIYCICITQKLSHMKHFFKHAAALLAIISATAYAENKTYDMGSYGYDAEFFKKKGINFIELSSPDGKQKVMVIPAYQGRVMTSSANGNEGKSFGWINYKFIEEGKTNPQFNPVGGEERFWFGPEGGPFSLYFKPETEQIYSNWLVPPVIDTETWDITSQNSDKITFAKEANLSNASGSEFTIGVERTVSLMSEADIQKIFGFTPSAQLNCVAYNTDNKVTNKGDEPWTKEKGLVSVWLLGMFNPTPTTTVFIPYKTDAQGVIVNDEYFGKVPSDRLIVDNSIIYFKIDGKYRSKIGIPAKRAMPLCGSYDSKEKTLTLLSTTIPSEPTSYVNGQWGPQDDPYNGDVINSYNDGPTEDGTIMGPFYEIETSSPALALAPGQTATHIQSVAHIQGDETEIAKIVKSLFGIDLDQITSKFNN